MFLPEVIFAEIKRNRAEDNTQQLIQNNSVRNYRNTVQATYPFFS